MNLQASIVLGVVFGLLAGACAFVIRFSEYKRNWAFTGKPVHQALRDALVTLLVFFAAALVLPWLFQMAVGK